MEAEQRASAARGLSAVDYVCLCADGIHVNISLEEHKLCLLVMIGVRADGYRELAQSWADLLRDWARRGMRPSAGRRGRRAGVATLWNRTKVTKGPGSRAAGPAMA